MTKKQRHRRINPVARAPILRKGGVHEKSRSAKRQAQKRQLQKLIAQGGAGPSGSIFLSMLKTASCFPKFFHQANGARPGKYHASACSGISQRKGDLLLVSLSKPSAFSWLSKRLALRVGKAHNSNA